MLSKQQILDAPDLPKQTVEVPEWGGSVIVQGLSAYDKDEFEQSIYRPGQPATPGGNAPLVRDLSNLRAKLVVRCVVDEEGNRLFGDGDAEALGKKSAAAVDRLFAVAQRLSALTDADVRTLEKNSVGG